MRKDIYLSTDSRIYARRRNSAWRIGAAVGAVVLMAALITLVVIGTRAGSSSASHASKALSSGGRSAGRSAVATAAPGADSSAEGTDSASTPTTVTVDLVGDMIFDRKIAALIATAGGEAPLAGVATQLAAADFTFGNLEGPLSTGGTRLTSKDYTLRGDPRGIDGLKAAGFDAVALGNNHSLDYGVGGLMDTIAILDQARIAHTGAGADRQAAEQIVYLKRSGTTVAFLSYSDILPVGFIAGPDNPGVAPARIDMSRVTRAIAQAKKHADHVVVSFHWGVQYSETFTTRQRSEAHQAIDAGADIVFGHHPHVIQGVELYKGKLIAYSLGDFVFDHSSRRTGEAFILQAELGAGGLGAIKAVPVYLDDSGAPQVVHGGEASTILVRLKLLSPADTIVHVSGDTASVTAR